jgi:hypothetical protein
VEKSEGIPLRDPSQDSLYQPANTQYEKIKSENEKLRMLLEKYQADYSNSQQLLAESNALATQLHHRFEEATATILRLRPPRHEHTESEIQEDFHALSESVKNWIESNCCGFLDNDAQGFEIMLKNSTDGDSWIERILRRFQWKAQYIIELKEHVLAAIIMRYLVDAVLNRPLSILLDERQEGLLTSIYDSMATMDPPKGNSTNLSCVDASTNYSLYFQICPQGVLGKVIQLQQSIVILHLPRKIPTLKVCR